MAYLFDRLGGETEANTATTGSQSSGKIAPLVGGGFVVIWQDGTGSPGSGSGAGGDTDTSVKAQLFDAAGNKVGGEFLVNTQTATSQHSPSVTGLEGGGFVVIWTDSSGVGGDASASAVKAQLFDAAGVKVGGEFLANTTTAGSQSAGSVAALDGGGFVAAWGDNSGVGDPSFGLRAQRFDSAGTKVGSEFLVNTITTGVQSFAEIAPLADGAFAISYHSDGAYRVQLFDAAGGKVGSEQWLGYATTGAGHRIAALGSGYVVAWGEVSAQLFDANGAKVGWGFTINTETTGTQVIDGLLSLPDGSVLATWTTPGSGGINDIHGQVIDPAGNKSGVEFLVNGVTTGAQSLARAALLASGDIALAWTDTSSGNANIEVQLLTASTTAPSDIAISTPTVSETAPENFSVATLSASGGALNADHSFAIVSDSTGGAFAIDDDQLLVIDNFLLDYETDPTVEVRVRAIDANGLTFEETLTLNIADVAVETRYAKGDVFRVNVADEQEDQAGPITPLASGGFLAAHGWHNSTYTDFGVRVRIFDANGRGVGNEFDLDVPMTSTDVEFAALPDGGFVAVFDAEADGAVANSVKVQRYDSAGNEVGGESILDTADRGSGSASVAALADGGFVVTWTRSFNPGTQGTPWPSEVYAQRFNAAGEKVGSEFAVPSDLTGDQYESHIAALPGGGFVVAWSQRDDGSYDDGIIRGQFFDAAGTRVGSEFTAVAEPVNRSISLAVLESGNVAIGWTKEIDDGNDIDAIAVQIVDPDGANVGDSFFVDVGELEAHSIAAIDGGGLVVSWSTDDGNLLFAQFFTETGVPMGDAVTIDSTSSEEPPEIGVLASGDVVVSWTDWLAGNDDVYAKILATQTYSPPSEGDDSLFGNAGDDVIAALGGNDRLDGGLGNDTLDGGAGFDTAVFAGNASAYSWSILDGETEVQGPDGTDTLTRIERLQFADGSYEVRGMGFAAPQFGLVGFGASAASGGWSDDDASPRMLADLNADGRADIVGFGANGVYVSLALVGGTFAAPILASGGFGSSASSGGWSDQDLTPRLLADINGDGQADIVGFGPGGTYAALSLGDGTFGTAFRASAGFGSSAESGGWGSQSATPRMVADVNADGALDLVGFGANGVYVALGDGGGSFDAAHFAAAGFGSSAEAGGWVNDAATPRMLANVGGDASPDLVGFGENGVYVSLAVGDGTFAAPFLASNGFGSSAASGGWSDADLFPRLLVDLDADGRADIVGFGAEGTYVAMSQADGSFAAPSLASAGFGSSAASGEWTSQTETPRMLADLNGDGLLDLIGFAAGGAYAAYGDGSGGFGAPFHAHNGFGSSAGSGGWGDSDLHPRLVTDLNGDGTADILGFGEGGVITSTMASDWVLI